jgi:hypothetical protein
MYLRLLCYFCVLTFLTSCENDIEINAPEKEIPVIYGFLDPHDSVQYIRVSRTFQTEGIKTPEEEAKNSGNQFLTDNIYVTNLRTLDTFFFVRSTDIPKDPGYFQSDVNFVYSDQGKMRASGRFFQSDQYQLGVVSPAGKTYSVKTSIVRDAKLFAGSPLFLGLYTKFGTLRILSLAPAPTTGAGAAIYDLSLRTYYYETISGVATIRYIDYPFQKNYSPKGRNGGEGFNLTAYKMLDYLNYIKDNIKPVDPSISRKFIRHDLVAYGGSDEVFDYFNLFKPSLAIAQKRPDYSNIPGALGIFSSRNSASVTFPRGPAVDQPGPDSTSYYVTLFGPNFVN